MRARTGLSIGVIIALAVAIWVAVSQGDGEPAPTTLATTPTTATTTTTVPPTTFTTVTTTSTAPTTTATTEPTTDPEARVEEVRLILQDLYYRWFDAIYRNDEEAVLDVVATEQGLASFRRAVDELEVDRGPTITDIDVREIEILRDDPDCLVTFAYLDLTAWRGAEAEGSVVDVMWPHQSSWRFASSWQNKGDRWQQDCTGIRDSELP